MPSKSQARQHSTSKTVKEKALSPRTSLSLHDRIRPDLPLFPPQEKASNNGNKKEELVKHMSRLPAFLQQEENPQDRILNFGVLDWDRLEKWKHKQKPSLGQSRLGAAYGGSISYKASSIPSGTSKTELLPKQNYSSCSKVYSPEQVNYSPEFLHHSSKVISSHDFTAVEKYSLEEQWRQTRKDKSNLGGTSRKRSHRTKAPDSYQRDCSEMGMPSSKCNELESDPAHQARLQKQDSVILILPKDFTQSGGLDEFQCASVDRNSVELNWSSFSDVFSVEERHFEDLNSDLPHSCPFPFMVGTETELDLNLDRLILGQRMHFPSDQPNPSTQRSRKLSVSFEVQHEENKKEELMSSAASTTPKELDRKSCHLSNPSAKDPSLARQLSLSIRRLSKSLSFREGSTTPHLNHATSRSDSAEALHIHDNSADDAFNSTDIGTISPLKELLHPVLKHNAAKPVSIYLPLMENLSIKSEKYGPTMKKAVLQLTLKSGLPLFKFLVETNNEILASTVKRLSPSRKNDPSWLYSFYSVQEVKRKGVVWRHRGSKGRSPGFSYNIVGQMKVSETIPSENEEKLTLESVLYGVDLNKVDGETSESEVKRELGAIVMKVPKEVSGDDQRKNHENNTAEIDVILPSAMHGLPNDGVPASLIQRWRTGGLCDCGGWDIGCKLQVLSSQDHNDPLQHCCNLFLQGAGKESSPVFRLLTHGEGIYIVEYESVASSLQAFAISVAVLSNQMQPSISDVNGCSGEGKCHYRSKSGIVQGEKSRYATYPPHSPVSRA